MYKEFDPLSAHKKRHSALHHTLNSEREKKIKREKPILKVFFILKLDLKKILAMD